MSVVCYRNQPYLIILLTGLRARAIIFIQMQQPLRVATKSSKYGGGKAPSQAHMLPVWNRLLDEAKRIEEDPTFLFDINYFVLDEISPIITGSCERYRTTKVFIHALGVSDVVLSYSHTNLSHIDTDTHTKRMSCMYDRPTVLWLKNCLRGRTKHMQ